MKSILLVDDALGVVHFDCRPEVVMLGGENPFFAPNVKLLNRQYSSAEVRIRAANTLRAAQRMTFLEKFDHVVIDLSFPADDVIGSGLDERGRTMIEETPRPELLREIIKKIVKPEWVEGKAFSELMTSLHEVGDIPRLVKGMEDSGVSNGVLLALELSREGVPVTIFTSGVHHGEAGILLLLAVGLLSLDALTEVVNRLKGMNHEWDGRIVFSTDGRFAAGSKYRFDNWQAIIERIK